MKLFAKIIDYRNEIVIVEICHNEEKSLFEVRSFPQHPLFDNVTIDYINIETIMNPGSITVNIEDTHDLITASRIFEDSPLSTMK